METSESRSSTAFGALVALVWAVWHPGQHISHQLLYSLCIPLLFFYVVLLVSQETHWQVSHFLRRSSLPRRLAVSFLGCMRDHCLLHQARTQILFHRLGFSIQQQTEGKPRVRFAVALGGRVAIFTGSAFFLLRVRECAVRLPLSGSSHCHIYQINQGFYTLSHQNQVDTHHCSEVTSISVREFQPIFPPHNKKLLLSIRALKYTFP